MRHCFQLIVSVLCLVGLSSCDGTSFRSSVPRMSVNMTVDTNTGVYVHFVPTALCDYVILDKDGYHYKGHTEPRTVNDRIGYGGVIIYINMLGNYDAYDLACPYCAERSLCVPCEIDGMYAVCPRCGEKYDLGSGTATPQNGKAHEYMLRLPISNIGGRLTVKQ